MLSDLQTPTLTESKAETSRHDKNEQSEHEAKLKQLSALLDFSIMAEGFENLLAAKKTDSQLIQAINEAT